MAYHACRTLRLDGRSLNTARSLMTVKFSPESNKPSVFLCPTACLSLSASPQVKGYRVYYTMDPSRPMNEWQIHNVQDSVITTIQSLVTSETYTIQVLAFTSVGDGPFSDPVHVKVMPGGECVHPSHPL